MIDKISLLDINCTLNFNRDIKKFNQAKSPIIYGQKYPKNTCPSGTFQVILNCQLQNTIKKNIEIYGSRNTPNN